MSDKSQRTEKPTPQRLRKAREKGQFPAAKELVAALQFTVLVAILTNWFGGWFEQSQHGLRHYLSFAFRQDMGVADWIYLSRSLLIGAFTPLLPAAAIMMGATLALQLGSTNLGVSLNKLAPSFSRFNPMSKLREIPRQNIPAGGQALAVLLLVSYVVYTIARQELPVLLSLPLASLSTGISRVGSSVEQVLWRSTVILLLIGVVEMARHRWMYHRDLSMTRQEVRDESKQNEGDPHIKGRIRRIRRDLLRRQMMKEVPGATAVVVNPTHFAVAIRYDSDAMASPRVVAKGKNYLALRIRQVAIDNGVPIIENPPLARALYDSVEVGREIPPDFYRAVAEILAYVYRLMGRRQFTR